MRRLLALLALTAAPADALGVRAASYGRLVRVGPSLRCCAADADASLPMARAAKLDALERCVVVAELECRAQACEGSGDLPGEVAAYVELLRIEPPDAHWVSAATSARRGLQELLLQGAQRELAACGAGGAKPQPTFFERAERAGEATRRQLASRALSDVGRIRSLVVGLLDRGASEARADMKRAEDAISYIRLVEGDPAIFATCGPRVVARQSDRQPFETPQPVPTPLATPNHSPRPARVRLAGGSSTRRSDALRTRPCSESLLRMTSTGAPV